MDVLPQICPVRNNPKFDCTRSGKDKERCGVGEDYLYCPAFSSWFWFKVASSNNFNIKKERDENGNA